MHKGGDTLAARHLPRAEFSLTSSHRKRSSETGPHGLSQIDVPLLLRLLHDAPGRRPHSILTFDRRAIAPGSLRIEGGSATSTERHRAESCVWLGLSSDNEWAMA
jgi:hypothetical protein